MIAILADHNIEGHTNLLWRMLDIDGWLDLGLFQIVTFPEVGLPFSSNDRVVWRFVQAHSMILLTGNRNMEGDDSLEQTIREENQPTSIPVVTIGNLDRVIEQAYRAACATRLAEIGMYLDIYRGAGRLYIP